MSPSQSYTVRPISYDDCKEWCLYKHYAHRIPVISYAYGLYDSDLTLVGICTYGLPANPSIGKGAFAGDWGEKLYELNRLCVNEGLPKNTLSFFLSQTFRLLPKPIALVSYADTSMGHHGYIYQATNWLYTGLSDRHIQYRIEGLEGKHDRHTLDETKKVGRGGDKLAALIDHFGEERVKVEERSRKHRYFLLLGDKRQKRAMLKALQYPVLSQYPKGDNSRYDASHQCEPQGLLF